MKGLGFARFRFVPAAVLLIAAGLKAYQLSTAPLPPVVQGSVFTPLLELLNDRYFQMAVVVQNFCPLDCPKLHGTLAGQCDFEIGVNFHYVVNHRKPDPTKYGRCSVLLNEVLCPYGAVHFCRLCELEPVIYTALHSSLRTWRNTKLECVQSMVFAFLFFLDTTEISPFNETLVYSHTLSSFVHIGFVCFCGVRRGSPNFC